MSDLDKDYAKRKLELLLRDLSNYNAGEFWREMSRIASGATGQPHAEELQQQLNQLGWFCFDDFNQSCEFTLVYTPNSYYKFKVLSTNNLNNLDPVCPKPTHCMVISYPDKEEI